MILSKRRRLMRIARMPIMAMRMRMRSMKMMRIIDSVWPEWPLHRAGQELQWRRLYRYGQSAVAGQRLGDGHSCPRHESSRWPFRSATANGHLGLRPLARTCPAVHGPVTSKWRSVPSRHRCWRRPKETHSTETSRWTGWTDSHQHPLRSGSRPRPLAAGSLRCPTRRPGPRIQGARR